MSAAPPQFDHVSVLTKANVFFAGKVVSHTVKFPDGTKKTLGLLYPGAFTFDTNAPERMELVAGACRVRLKGKPEWTAYSAGESFDVPGKSAFDIVVDQGVTEYVCSFLA